MSNHLSHILDCRSFPPVAGLSFSCWFQINRFSSACDSHPIRLLSVVRHMSRTEQQYICLSISFSAYDGCLVISTEEEAFTYLGMSAKSSVNICPRWTLQNTYWLTKLIEESRRISLAF